MMTDTSLQQIVQHQTVNLYDSNNVQLGETNTIHCRQTNHLKQDVDRMKNEIQQLKMNNETQADEIQQLKSRMKVMEVKTGAKNTNKNIFKEKDEMIKLHIVYGLYMDMTISISRDKTVDELEKMVQEEWSKKYGRDDDVYIYYIYSDDVKQTKYNYKQHNKHLPLSHYNITHGDIVKWR